MTSSLPSSAGRYQLHTRLGQGATGVVYVATDPDRQRQVAVKVMLPEIAQDAANRQHFLLEARAISRLRHRHLAAVYEAASNDEPPWLAMELLRGKTLAERLTMSPAPSLIESLEIVDQLCVGLQFAHEHGLVHRNVTPANIWLLDDGSVKLVDFGLPPTSVKTVRDQRALVGRVAYMAPEQVAAKPVDGRADIFSAGVVLYELLVGRRPFEADSITGIFQKVVNQAAPSIADRLPPEAASLEAVLQRALEKDPARRHPDPIDLAADLSLVRLALLEAQAANTPVVITEEITEETEEADVADDSPADLSFGRDEVAATESVAAYQEQEIVKPAPLARRHETKTLGSFLRENPLAVAGGGVALVAAVLVGAWLAWRTPSTSPPARPARSSVAPPTTASKAASKAAEVQVESEPADAELFVNGASLGVRTPANVPADRLRGAEVRAVKPGFEPLVVRPVPADLDQGRLVLKLVPEPPLIAVSGSAPFPFEVLNGRTVVSREATSHKFTVRGEPKLRVRAPEYYLDRPVSFQAGQSSITLFVPPLGRLSVRVSPSLERCRVSVDGIDFGSPPYPPVPYQQLVAGTHRVQLTCPDDTVRTEVVTVEASRDRPVIFR